ncbi:hypothetical protein E2C01_096153 [Portunus trituberculatus]|uniref:Uncharacterized protein n=1 Tax=Portunus trituberculatus TaxID=210409 RepID=A0A5B7K7I5_PORTR|nr:hypothetical protein [Portunus trituberculatus]
MLRLLLEGGVKGNTLITLSSTHFTSSPPPCNTRPSCPRVASSDGHRHRISEKSRKRKKKNY